MNLPAIPIQRQNPQRSLLQFGIQCPQSVQLERPVAGVIKAKQETADMATLAATAVSRVYQYPEGRKPQLLSLLPEFFLLFQGGEKAVGEHHWSVHRGHYLVVSSWLCCHGATGRHGSLIAQFGQERRFAPIYFGPPLWRAALFRNLRSKNTSRRS